MLIHKRNLFYFASIAGLLLLCSITSVEAQEENLTFQNRLKSILGSFNNVRFSSIAYYEINSKQVGSLKKIVKEKLNYEEEEMPANQGQDDGIDSARKKELVDAINRLFANGRRTENQIRESFSGDVDDDDFDYSHLNATDQEIKIAYQSARGGGKVKSDIYKMFLLTTKREGLNDSEVPDIIALILCKENLSKEEYETQLISYYNQVLGGAMANDRNIITYPELQNFIITNSSDPTKSDNLYDQLILEFRQGNCMPITAEVRGIGTELTFFKTYGKSKSLLANENDIVGADVQKFLRISDGQPYDYQKENEIIVSPDLISYRKYAMEYWEDEEGRMQPAGYTNSNLPSYGVEIKFGLEEINYPSFFSERMMVRAIWDNVRLGIVLPTSGWSFLSKDISSVDRRFTYAGFGLSGAFDFPIKIIPQSGVFSMSGSYVFGDAHEASYKDRDIYFEENGFNYKREDLLFNDYLVRYTAQAHYTFGLSLDDTYQLRFGIGASIYGTELWRDYEEEDEMGEMVINYKQANDETVGGISLKAEFMSTDATTPFGASLQYFDESLYANAWIQFPILADTFFARIDAKGYVAAFKDTLHPWENKSIIMPSIRLIFNF